MMNKRLALLSATLLLSLACLEADVTDAYTREGVVISSVCGIVSVEDASGNVWQYYGDNVKGAHVTLKMRANHTSSIEDDVVVGIK